MPKRIEHLYCKVCGNHISSNAHKKQCKLQEEEIKVYDIQAPQLLASLSTSESPPLRIYIEPRFEGVDEGDGGVRRVVDSQREYWPRFGIEIVDSIEQADITVVHIAPYEQTERWLQEHPEFPYVIDNHGLYWAEYEWARWCIDANRKCMEGIRRADIVVAHSEWVAQAIRRHTMRQVSVIPHPIDASKWTQREHKGYILWNKNRPDAVCDPTPVLHLAESIPDIEFVTTYAPSGVSIPKNLISTGRLEFGKAKQLIEEAAIYLCTTRETFGIGTLEAMAAGVPIVGWAWGGQREFLTHKDNAWLSVPEDYEQLMEGIYWALERRETIASRAYKVLQQFSHDKIDQQYIQLLRDLVEKKRLQWESPRTSIIVTAYNLEKYLPDCLSSIENQSDRDWECIIVDDASPDKSGQIADQWADKDSHFSVIHNEKNEYLAGARNIGIERAQGRYILPLDSDDFLHEDTVKNLANSLDKNRSIHIAYGNVKFVDEDGVTPTDYGAHGLAAGYSGWPMEFRFDWQIQQKNLLPYSSMFRREVWEATGGYRRRCRTAEDADFWTRASSYGFRPAMVTEQTTLIYRNRDESMSRVEGGRDWIDWFPWHYYSQLLPGGALTNEQFPIHSCDPPIIDIVIPVGPGHEELLWDALDSIDAQTFRQWNCIVVNDTGKRLRNLPSWVKVLETGGIATGVAHARNIALRNGRARYFLPLDADDYLQPDCLRALFDVQSKTGKDIVYSDWYDESEDRNWKVYEPPDYNAQLLIDKGAIHAVTALYLRKIWEEAGGFDEKLPAWEDWALQISAASVGRCSVRVPYPLWVYRKHTGFRREDNYANFESGKQGIIARWGEYFNREKKLMACGCKDGNASLGTSQLQRSAMPPNGEALLVEYTGAAEGTKMYRAPSGTIYYFGGGGDRLKYVLEQDLEFFSILNDFRAVTKDSESQLDMRTLVAEGPPVR